MSLNHKIDFAVIFTVTNANPNGDPLDGNRPRTTLEGLGEISDVCLKRKIRNKLMDMGQNIFVQSDDRRVDDYKTLKERATPILKQKGTSAELAQKACQEWYDVRAFGQVFALKDKDAAKGTGVSIGIRGPVTIQPAFSRDTVNITSTQITKSVSNDGDGSKKSSDTMGMKHRWTRAPMSSLEQSIRSWQNSQASRMKMHPFSNKRFLRCLKEMPPLHDRKVACLFKKSFGGNITVKAVNTLLPRFTIPLKSPRMEIL